MTTLLLSSISAYVRNFPRISHRRFAVLLVFLVLCAILRSAIATRLDDFTIDEGYHIVAGVSYVQRGDFRINPEHPPLVKLWVGAIESAFGFHLSPIREIHDKPDERHFVNEDVYAHNNPDVTQRRSRAAMLIFNGILLFALGFALRRVFGSVSALGSILFLAIDPTVAAHLPVVMTDLPVSLCSTIAIVLAGRAFRDWRVSDFILSSFALGLALASKHSAPIFCVVLAVFGLACALFGPRTGANDSRLRRCALVTAMLLGSVLILWGTYRFRFTESTAQQEVFNRPLSEKISDLHSSGYRFAVTNLAKFHLLPRAYLWGLADVARAGLEGRIESRLVFGRPYWGKGPAYFFPGVVAVKLPIGLSLLAFAGIFLFLARRLPPEWKIPTALCLFATFFFFFVLARGSTYAGIRHALPAVVLLSTFAGFAVHAAFAVRVMLPKFAAALAFILAAISALPVLRPWEYYNELVGGKDHAYLYFNDEGVDLSLRFKEVAHYYHTVLEPRREAPLMQYFTFLAEGDYRKLDYIGREGRSDEHIYDSPNFTGTIIVEARQLGPRVFGDMASLRSAIPVARFGNAVVFRGTFDVGAILGADRYWEGIRSLYSDKPDPVTAEKYFRRSVELDPSCFWVFIILGNIYVGQGDHDKALRAYQDARDHSPAGTVFRREIDEQLHQMATLPVNQVRPLRDPDAE
jgi:tetratricopeptide (TPR) repeat protein